MRLIKWGEETVIATGTKAAFNGQHPASMCRQCRGSSLPEITICIAMIIAKADATQRRFGLGVNSGLRRSWTGAAATSYGGGCRTRATGNVASDNRSVALRQQSSPVGQIPFPLPIRGSRSPSGPPPLAIGSAPGSQPNHCQGTGRFRPQLGPHRPARSRSVIRGINSQPDATGRTAFPRPAG